ncbi:MAG: MogA/MoaB family molybdenum cofactor biosynthesis protein [Deltaproteobacteria bacterium]|nr:MogA/MoaB family molybdenum cofactor biosynthesis protein [Deltaproteobacteria bacterium]
METHGRGGGGDPGWGARHEHDRHAHHEPAGRATFAPADAEHKAYAPESVGCMVITVSDSRTPETDTGGRLIRELLGEQGHAVTHHEIIRDEPTEVRRLLEQAVEDDRTQAVIFTGGTGLSSRDTTYEAVEGLLDKRLTGFGELFRFLSYQEIGSAAIMSRATAGTYRRKVVVALPGSANAVKLAMTRLILPELAHMVSQAAR